MNDTEAKAWAAEWLRAVKEAFGEERIVCAGLQGSRGRGEASPESDIDLVLILDKVTADDLITYSQLLDTLPHREELRAKAERLKDLERQNIQAVARLLGLPE